MTKYLNRLTSKITRIYTNMFCNLQLQLQLIIFQDHLNRLWKMSFTKMK